MQSNLQLESVIHQQEQVIKMNADLGEQLLNQIELNRLQEDQKRSL
jgi:Growth-Arrest-Specific Protein 2 Domain